LSSSRRRFLGWLAAVVPAAGGVRLRFPFRREPLDDVLLRALASAILPSELGPAGSRRAADALAKWVREYRPGAELNHGYGTARLRTTGADPSTRWALQLRTMEMDARTAHNTGFASITDEQRRAIVEAQLSVVEVFPGDIAGASHVALALLASFYASPEATDLCYEAAIGRQLCRPLAESSRRPVQLRRAGGGGS
jgi:hypothetical protein